MDVFTLALFDIGLSGDRIKGVQGIIKDARNYHKVFLPCPGPCGNRIPCVSQRRKDEKLCVYIPEWRPAENAIQAYRTGKYKIVTP